MKETKKKNEFVQFTFDHKPYVIINGIVYIDGIERHPICDMTALVRALPQFAGVVAAIAWNIGFEMGWNAHREKDKPK